MDRWWWLRIVFTVAVALSLGADCEQQRQPDSPRAPARKAPAKERKPPPKACNTWTVRAPAAKNIGGSVVIQARVRSGCDAVPSRFVVQLTLWYKPANAREFILVKTGAPCEKTPLPGNDVDCEINAYGVCKPGYFQLHFLVTGNLQGRDFAFNAPERPQSRIWRCPSPG